jgi:predicted helicase
MNEFFNNDENYCKNILKVKENSSFNINSTKLKTSFSENFIKPISYRPFDERYIYFDSLNFIERSRGNLINHFDNQNHSLVFRRQQPDSNDLYIFTSKQVIADGYIRSDNKGGESIAPLYVYNGVDLLNSNTRTPNLNMEIVSQIATGLGLTFTNEKEETPNTFAPIDLLDYIYAVLHSTSYREKYKEFLKIDFPRVPAPLDHIKFWQLVKLGGELRQIHLLESPTVEKYITGYPEDGDNVVKKPSCKEGNVYINETQYFSKVPEVAWNFYIGGYQPAQKWLKDRKDRELSYEDILHYQKIIVALSETDRLMKEIDKINIL